MQCQRVPVTSGTVVGRVKVVWRQVSEEQSKFLQQQIQALCRKEGSLSEMNVMKAV